MSYILLNYALKSTLLEIYVLTCNERRIHFSDTVQFLFLFIKEESKKKKKGRAHFIHPFRIYFRAFSIYLHIFDIFLELNTRLSNIMSLKEV